MSESSDDNAEDLTGSTSVVMNSQVDQQEEHVAVQNVVTHNVVEGASDADELARQVCDDAAAAMDSPTSSMMETAKMGAVNNMAGVDEDSGGYDSSVCYFSTRIALDENGTDAGSSRMGNDADSMKAKTSIKDDVSALTCDVESTIGGAKTVTTLASHSQVKSISAKSSLVGKHSHHFAPLAGEKFPSERIVLEPHDKPRHRARCLIIFILALLVVTAIGGAVIGARLRGSISKSSGLGPAASAAPSAAPNFEGDGLLELLKSVSFDGGASLGTGSSPQYRAFIWLWEDDKIAKTWSNATRIQRYALATLYYATGGYRWENKEGWLSDAPHCEWYSNENNIFCEADQVTMITLANNNLAGSLPAELALLSSSLEFLNVSNSTLGQIPTEIGLLTELENLSLDDSNLNSTIPSEVGALSALTLLDLARNPLVAGQVPTELGNLEALRVFSAGVTQLTGGVPATFGKLTLLEELYLHQTFQPGEKTSKLPTEIGLMTNLRIMRLDRSGIAGRIPSEIGNLTELRRLILHDNAIGGRIPPHVGRLTLLKTLSLDLNRLVGPIPTSFKKLVNLEIASLTWNQLDSFDDGLFTLTQLQKLLLNNNKLKGTIPTLIGQMSRLEGFDASWNMLTSTLPSEVGNARQLRRLSVENNTIAGTIPIQIYELEELNYLGLGQNKFGGNGVLPRIRRLSHLDRFSVGGYLDSDRRVRGKLPSEMGLLTKLRDVTIVYTNMTGTIPTEIGNLLNLKSFGIIHGNITGPIPSELGLLRQLEDLWLADSPFTGQIPSELGRIRFLEEVSLKGTALSGTMPSEVCQLGGLELLEVETTIVCYCCDNINEASDE